VAGEVAYAAGAVDSGLVLIDSERSCNLQEITGGKDFQEWVATSEESGVVKYWKDCLFMFP
jgi:hypothetical protein